MVIIELNCEELSESEFKNLTISHAVGVMKALKVESSSS